MDSIFKGAATALITPMKNGEVDFDALDRLVDFQIDAGIDALVAAGTTGESSTLTDEEHVEVIARVVKKTAGRVPVVAGTGSNDCAYAIKLSADACKAGADALLLVTPYYNKATQGGLIEMYKAVAESVDKPIILYNVPSRTGVNIEPQTYAALAGVKNIKAIKEASGNLSKAVETMALVGDKLDLYSGNDDQIVPLMSIGGLGVISVLSNLLPKETSEMCHAFLRGDVKTAAAMQFKYIPLIQSLFCEVNPIPVKAAMTRLGFGDGSIRLPLTKMEKAHEEILLSKMRAVGLKV
ncbi:MAG: 4-hydroxy-tetrahydrodipicolinate synthase [Clostridia bacterium]|nr:4-hydroxy-tetrahydrodipicolinate synthase [Clostridia bacterium]